MITPISYSTTIKYPNTFRHNNTSISQNNTQNNTQNGHNGHNEKISFWDGAGIVGTIAIGFMLIKNYKTQKAKDGAAKLWNELFSQKEKIAVKTELTINEFKKIRNNFENIALINVRNNLKYKKFESVKKNEAKTINDILENENSLFEDVEKWSNQELNSTSLHISSNKKQNIKQKEEFKQKINGLLKESLDEINETGKIKQKTRKNKYFKEVEDKHNLYVQNKKKKIENALNQVCNDIDNSFTGYVAIFDPSYRIKQEKYSILGKSLDESIQAIAKQIEQPLVDGLKETPFNIQEIPRNLPKNIREGSFFKHVSNIDINDKKTLNDSAAKLGNELNEKFNLKDLDLQLKRIQLRHQASIKNTQERNWYKFTLSNMQKLREATEQYLRENIVKKQLGNTVAAQDDFIAHLNNYSQKFGDKSPRETIFNLNKAHEEFMNQNKGFIDDYQKIKDRIVDESFYDRIIGNRIIKNMNGEL